MSIDAFPCILSKLPCIFFFFGGSSENWILWVEAKTGARGNQIIVRHRLLALTPSGAAAMALKFEVRP
jgi:hypothetical protein